MLLVLGALALLGGITLGINKMLLDKTETMLETEAALSSIALGQSMIDEIMVNAFDQAVVGGAKLFNPTAMTGVGSLGREGSEGSLVSIPEAPDTANAYRSFKYYNDIDDYNLYKRYAITSMGTFTIVDSVYYVLETSPDVKSNTQTFCKKVVVTVTHPNMKYPLTLSDISVYRRYF